MPFRGQFSPVEYYESLLHEMVHWTQHATRLDSHDSNYAYNELVAEIGSCFLSAELKIPITENLSNHASYLQNWLQAMKDDHKFIFQASTQASKAADYILSFSRVEQPQEEVLAE